MGQITGAAIVSHHPGLMQCEDFRKLMGAGQDSDLIAGYARLRDKIAAARPDVVLVFDSHWFTTGYHLIDGGARYQGSYISDEMPWYLHGVPYDYRGHPEFALAVEAVAKEKGVQSRAICHPELGRQYATINLVTPLAPAPVAVPVASTKRRSGSRASQARMSFSASRHSPRNRWERIITVGLVVVGSRRSRIVSAP